MAEIAENAADQIKAQAVRKRIQIEISVHDDTDTWLEGNGELLERTLVNLFTNAIKYSPPDTTITVFLEDNGENLRCSVKDQGYGLPQEAIPQLFERFSRFHQQTLKKERGTGLGLRFVKTVIDRHGATIAVHSEPGKGSEFCLNLPRRH